MYPYVKFTWCFGNVKIELRCEHLMDSRRGRKKERKKEWRRGRVTERERAWIPESGSIEEIHW